MNLVFLLLGLVMSQRCFCRLSRTSLQVYIFVVVRFVSLLQERFIIIVGLYRYPFVCFLEVKLINLCISYISNGWTVVIRIIVS